MGFRITITRNSIIFAHHKTTCGMKIQQDKKKHFVAGFATTTVVSLLLGYIVGALASVIAGVAKEVYDKVSGKGTPELLDVVATVTGAVAAVATSVAVSSLYSVITGN